uniref:Sugar transporter SWEET1 n=1 Tax=Panagrolaimus superbus TaxID=310955 RepID=A0A914YD34_9BILA
MFFLLFSEDESLTFLSVLSITAIITTVSLFFCGIPICIEIFRRKSTNEISGFPFVMGLLGGAFWLRYGFLKDDRTMITVNAVGVTLMFIYTIFYIYFSKEKGFVLLQFFTVIGLVGIMAILVQIYGWAIINFLGFVCMSFNIVNFGAPLAGMRVVLRKKCCDSLPLPLCTANLLVSSQWFVYGFLVSDIYIIIPNGAGVFLAIVQLSLFLIFPRKVGGNAPLSCLFNSERRNKKNKPQDIEGGIVDKKRALPPANMGLEGANWDKQNIFDRPLSSVRSPRRSNMGLTKGSPFGASLSSSTSTTYTGTTSVSNSHISGAPNGLPDDVPAITIASSDNEIDEDDINVETPLNSPSSHEHLKKSFQFDRIGEIDLLEASWLENELSRAQSAPEINNAEN